MNLLLQRIINVMKAKKISQVEICEKLSISKNNFTEWKSGRSSSYTKYISQIADILDVSVDYLYGRQGKIVPQFVNVDKIKMLCKVKGIKQSYLCEQLGLHFTFLNDVKKGSSPMTEGRLNKIAEILDINVEYLKDEIEEIAPYKKTKLEKELSIDDELVLELFNSLTDKQKESLLSLIKNFF